MNQLFLQVFLFSNIFLDSQKMSDAPGIVPKRRNCGDLIEYPAVFTLIGKLPFPRIAREDSCP